MWFHALLPRLGHTLLVGEAAKIRAMVVRKIKTSPVKGEAGYGAIRASGWALETCSPLARQGVMR